MGVNYSACELCDNCVSHGNMCSLSVRTTDGNKIKHVLICRPCLDLNPELAELYEDQEETLDAVVLPESVRTDLINKAWHRLKFYETIAVTK